jgi:hypothetical protein
VVVAAVDLRYLGMDVRAGGGPCFRLSTSSLSETLRQRMNYTHLHVVRNKLSEDVVRK